MIIGTFLVPGRSRAKHKIRTNCSHHHPKLQGKIPIKLSTPTLHHLHRTIKWTKPGGTYDTECPGYHRIAVIIPYRKRSQNLLRFLAHMHPFIYKQQIYYTFYVIEQFGNDLFNRGKLLNIGYTHALQDANYDCLIFHDVDLLPEDDRNPYHCEFNPKHMSVIIDTLDPYDLCYPTFIGGAFAIKGSHFKEVNGFSNLFWGWGGEDDEFYQRLKYYHLNQIIRYSKTVARYKSLPHKSQPKNGVRFGKIYQSRVENIFLKDGLNSLKYKVIKKKLQKLFTWILVDLFSSGIQKTAVIDEVNHPPCTKL